MKDRKRAAMKKPDYSYQKNLVTKAFKDLMDNRHVILAACPGAGKTRMAIKLADKYKKKFPKSKILILTHGQVLLREQWADVMDEHCSYNTLVVTPGTADFEIEAADILIAIPQTLRFRDMSKYKIDFLICDEAHHWYLSEAVQDMMLMVKPKHELLLTGSPSPYLGDPKWSVLGITVQELLEYGVLTDPVIELAEANYQHTSKSYLHNMNLKADAELSTEHTLQTLDGILSKFINRLSSDSRATPDGWVDSDLLKLHKTMIVCHTQAQAKDVASYFKAKKVPYALSISFENDGVEALAKFKGDPKCNLFIVVNRGTLGFDYDKLANLIDMSGTLNVNRLFQMLCRVVRPDKDSPKQTKLFVKVCSTEMAKLTHFVMSYVVSLSDPEYYFSYKTKVAKRTKIPVTPEFLQSLEEDEYDEETDLLSPTKKKRFPRLPKLNTFNDIKSIRTGEIRSFAYTDFETVRRKIDSPSQNIWNESTAMKVAKECESRKDLERKYPGAYSWFWRKKKLHLLTELYGKNNRTSWSAEKIKAIAKGCKDRAEFRQKYAAAYNWLARNQRLDIYRALPAPKRSTQFTVDGVLEMARQYKTLNEFRTANYGAYSFLRREKKMYLLKSLYSVKADWTVERALRAASRCETPEQFKHTYFGAYTYLASGNLLPLLERVYE
jgi:superfamily II DNA or RNA helicase